MRLRERFSSMARIIRAKNHHLENVKNLKSHDKGKTFKVIMDTLDELGYEVADAAEMGKNDPKVIDGKHFYLSTENVSFWSVSAVI